MSASREKKRRQEVLAANGGVDPKAAREAERLAAEKKSKILYTSIAAIFVAVSIFLVVFNSGILQRSRAALTIDGVKYTVGDVSYYYQNAYQSFMRNGYGSYFINTSQPLSTQKCVFDSTKTWADYFKDEAVNTMKLVHAAATAAKAEGMKLGDEQLQNIKDNLELMKAEAKEHNYTSLKSYLTDIYGSNMTVATLERNMELAMLANMYTTAYYDSLVYTDDEILAYYEENKNTYDTVDGICVTISGKPETKKDADGKEIEPTDEEKAAALAEAKTKADTLMAEYESGGELERLAEGLKATYTADKEMTYTGSSTAADWLFDEARVAGDKEIVFDKEDSTYYVLIFNGRQREEAPSYSVRHILITEANLNLAEGEKAGEGEVLLAAQTILDKWDGSEKHFAELAREYTQDSGSVANGGLYENVKKGDMVAEFNDWCYAEGRKSGDVEIVETSYGQHIMYFVGYGDADTAYWKDACRDALADKAYLDWETALINSVTVTVMGGMSVVG